MEKPKKTVLIVDDDIFLSSLVIEELKARGYKVVVARTLGEAQKCFKSQKINIAILDIWFKLGDDCVLDKDDLLATRDGFGAGKVLANWIKNNYPKAFFIAYSHEDNENIKEWFCDNGGGFVSKLERPQDFVKYYIDPILEKKKPKCFIVHGHDETLKYKLKNFLQNALNFPEPIILHEQPGFGRTIIEKFEEEAKDADLVFVLLTPDDIAFNPGSEDEKKRRSRQNVIFEMGYFMGKLGRKRGKIILLYKEENELPSDISGLIPIDVTGGIELAGERIRKEVAPFLS